VRRGGKWAQATARVGRDGLGVEFVGVVKDDLAVGEGDWIGRVFVDAEGGKEEDGDEKESEWEDDEEEEVRTLAVGSGDDTGEEADTESLEGGPFKRR
jgi:hypothetical protein